jgi:cysteine sulfinate desulfinase/cysteine desulfurase-like protein
MKCAPEVMDGSFRISLCRENTTQEIDTFIRVLREDIVERYLG